MFGGWGDGETMFAIHKSTANKVAHNETRARVIDVEPESPCVRAGGVSGEAWAGVLVEWEVFAKGGGFENGDQLVRCEGDELAFFIALKSEPEEGEVIDFDAGLQGENLDLQHHVWGLFRDYVLEKLWEDSEVIRVWNGVRAEGDCPPAGLDSSNTYAPLGIAQMAVDLVIDDVLLPKYYNYQYQKAFVTASRISLCCCCSVSYNAVISMTKASDQPSPLPLLLTLAISNSQDISAKSHAFCWHCIYWPMQTHSCTGSSCHTYGLIKRWLPMSSVYRMTGKLVLMLICWPSHVSTLLDKHNYVETHVFFFFVFFGSILWCGGTMSLRCTLHVIRCYWRRWREQSQIHARPICNLQKTKCHTPLP